MGRGNGPCWLIVIFLLCLTTCPLRAQAPADGRWGDQGDGTYANPVLPADFSDLDAIRVGNDFFAISSTFQYSPGIVVLHSRDLVNWAIVSHVVSDVTRISPEMNWDVMGRRGRGIWAGSIRFHAGRFWVFAGTPDEGFFVSTAARAAGPWTPPVMLRSGAGAALGPGWDDPCPFWDDDGRLYLVATHFAAEGAAATKYNIHLFGLTPDGEHFVAGSDRVIHQSRGSEANKLYKIDGLYFHYFSEVHAEGRVAMMERSKSLDGPWESHQLNHVQPAIDKEPNQGGLIELEDGRWYFLTHQGHGDWEGRAGVLLPVSWIEGWPILGKPGPDGLGTMLWSAAKPIAGGTAADSHLTWSGEFTAAGLDPAWEWRNQPRAGMWSLTVRPGALRLYGFRSLRTGDFASVADVLTQRALRTPRNVVTAKLDVGRMVDGQRGGLVQFARTVCMLAVVQTGGSARRLVANLDGKETLGPVLTPDSVWLRSSWDLAGVSQFSYSVDGQSFVALGGTCQLTWGSYRGDRIGLFTVNDAAGAGTAGGYLDIDRFDYETGHR